MPWRFTCPSHRLSGASTSLVSSDRRHLPEVIISWAAAAPSAALSRIQLLTTMIGMTTISPNRRTEIAAAMSPLISLASTHRCTGINMMPAPRPKQARARRAIAVDSRHKFRQRSGRATRMRVSGLANLAAGRGCAQARLVFHSFPHPVWIGSPTDCHVCPSPRDNINGASPRQLSIRPFLCVLIPRPSGSA